MSFTVAAFYKFSPLPQYREVQPAVLAALKALGVKGSLLLAEEGINGTIAALPEKLGPALAAIEKLTGIQAIECKYSNAPKMPFKRLKVRLKKEIVTIGNVAANPNNLVGTYVEPGDWNALISDPDVILIDTRNAYEFDIGTFKGAIDPKTERFGQFPQFVREKLQASKNARIAMFCTGGIRCEKASSFMRHEGYENVFHLKGGILKYLELIPRDESLWQGGCFVFDERVAVGHGLEITDHSICYGCTDPLTPEDRQSPLYERGVCCARCAPRLSEKQKSSNRERQRQFDLAAKSGRVHLGPEA
jgi:UPF0176 protein